MANLLETEPRPQTPETEGDWGARVAGWYGVANIGKGDVGAAAAAMWDISSDKSPRTRRQAADSLGVPIGAISRHVEHAVRERITPTLRVQIDTTAHALSVRTGIDQKTTAKVLAHWTGRVPREEREDVLQMLGVAILEANPPNGALLQTICKCRIADWWRAYMVRAHYSLDAPLENAKGDGYTLADVLEGTLSFETQIEGHIMADTIWALIPANLKDDVGARLQGKRISGAGRVRLHRWLKGHPLAVACVTV